MNDQLSFLYEDDATRHLDDILSLERFQRYLDAANGDRSLAYKLYALNTAIAEAMFSPIQMLEVALRNRFHAELSKTYGDDWYDQIGVITDVFQRNQIAEAKLNLVRDRKPIEPGRVVASLSFGFWTSCLGRRYEDMWRRTLRHAFQHAPDGLTRKRINSPLTRIRLLRNRIAHHEPLLKHNLLDRHDRIVEITGWLSPIASDWSKHHCRFSEVYDDDLSKLFRT
ncbi:hypothetical protein Q669_21500 [Labrenzia sp. C1B10]|uniref:Abi family protein n=1 Tax=unclassified Labrenzia TaxID=2648686 RepID=UPI0003B8196E|nr:MULTISPECIES: Abi family protein [unclassified Labrenzia]ERP97784.1 hypothetical protein Q669_21500 [Labrenzia sp. C1B10]ERS01576.1 hypothetical protein Q675_05615 [Labrenzia sp. C1B70]